MDSQLDSAFQQSTLNFLCESAFAAQTGERRISAPITACLNRHQLDGTPTSQSP
jgi:hypothetical protein